MLHAALVLTRVEQVVGAARLSGYSARASSAWCRSNAGDSERIRGSFSKLCRGGGELVAHSSERPQPHGSSTPTLGDFLDLYTL